MTATRTSLPSSCPVRSVLCEVDSGLGEVAVAIDRRLWEETINDGYVPPWPCPGCGAAALSVVKDSLKTVHDAATADNVRDRDFPSEEETGRFVCLLQCSRVGCGETCAVSGNYTTGVADTDRGYFEYAACQPLSITPPPPVIRVPRECPAPVKQEVGAACMLHWSDPASCLNRIRNALELLLTDLKIPRGTVNKKEKRVRHSLHARIQILLTKKPKLKDICDRMMAVKHLGNAGSHSGVMVER